MLKLFCKQQTCLLVNGEKSRRISSILTGVIIRKIFDGLEKTTRKTLGEETIDFFADNFQENIEQEERELLERSLSPPPKDPTDEGKRVFRYARGMSG